MFFPLDKRVTQVQVSYSELTKVEDLKEQRSWKDNQIQNIERKE